MLLADQPCHLSKVVWMQKFSDARAYIDALHPHPTPIVGSALSSTFIFTLCTGQRLKDV